MPELPLDDIVIIAARRANMARGGADASNNQAHPRLEEEPLPEVDVAMPQEAFQNVPRYEGVGGGLQTSVMEARLGNAMFEEEWLSANSSLQRMPSNENDESDLRQVSVSYSNMPHNRNRLQRAMARKY